MTNAKIEQVCPDCGEAVPAWAPEALCPRCLARCVSGDSLDGSASHPASLLGAQDLRFFGDYELLEELARGGMGVVFRARQLGVNREVALKLLLGGASVGREFVHRFHTEAAASARLDHPHIVPVYEFGEHEGTHFLAMKFLEGGTLARRIAQAPGALPPREIAKIMRAIAEAVQHAHQHGVLHRDLKPANILLDAAGEPRVADFGLAHLAEVDTQLTLPSTVLGTAAYMAPEQAVGGSAAASTAADVYGLGAVFYEMLTGQPPFAGATIGEILRKVLEEDPVRPGVRAGRDRIPADLEIICLKCLEKDPAKRYSTARELADDLGRYLAGEPIQARPISSLERARRWCQRKPALALASAAAILLLLVVLAGVPVAALRIRAERDAAEANLYAADMLLAQQAARENNVAHARQLLSKHSPSLSGTSAIDLRSWEWNYLAGELRDDQVAILPGGVETARLAISPDGLTLAASATNRVVLFDLPSGRIKAEISHKTTAGSWGLDFTPEGELVFAPMQGPLEIWSLNPLRQTGQLPDVGPRGIVRLSKDGKWLAASSRNEGVELWDWRQPKCLLKVSESTGWVYSRGIAFSEDSRYFAYGEFLGGLVIWDLEAGRELRQVPIQTAPQVPPLSLAFSPDGSALVSGGVDRVTRLWDTTSWTQRHAFTNALGLSRSLTFLPDNRTLVLGDEDTSLAVWDWRDWRPLRLLRGHQYGVNAVAATPDGRMVFSADAATIRSWNPQREKADAHRATLSGQDWPILSPDGGAVLEMLTNGTFTVWDTATLRPRFNRPVPVPTARWGAVGRNAEKIAFNAAGGGIHLWSADRPDTSQPLPGPPAYAVEFSRDGQQFAGLTKDGYLQVWALDQGGPIARCPERPGTNDWETLRYDSATKTVLVQYMDLNLIVWNHETGRVQKKLLSGRAWDLILLPGGTVGIASELGGVEVLNLATGESHTEFQSQAMAVRRIALTADHRRLAVASAGTYVTLWDLVSRQPVLRLDSQPTRPSAFGFSEDGQTLINVTQDEIRTWTAFKGESLPKPR